MRKDEFPIVDKFAKDKVNDMLDKIRAEIDELEIYYDNDYFSVNRDAMFKRNDVLRIIDKYRKEQTKE